MKRALLLLLLVAQPALAEFRWHVELIGFTDNGLKQMRLDWSDDRVFPRVAAREGRGWLLVLPVMRVSRLFDASIEHLSKQGECSVYGKHDGRGTTINYDARWLQGWTALGPRLKAGIEELPDHYVAVDLNLGSTFFEGKETAHGRFLTGLRVMSGDGLIIECLDQQGNSIPREGFPHTILYIRVEFDKENE
ncbi:MAG: hypothetical protein AB7S38_32580 [Vulcanimicrobiota bacterium]